jgi:biopolymer transport protein ExbD
MTPAIDVVFQLLAFFLLSLRVIVQEGDLEVKMPLAAQRPNSVPTALPMVIPVRIDADAQGNVAAIWLGERRLQTFAALQSELLAIVGDTTGPDSARAQAEVELGFDYDLRYEHAVAAITAVKGYINQGQVVKLIERVRFAPQRPET